MKKNSNNAVIFTLKNSNTEYDKVNEETLRNSVQDLKTVIKKFKRIQSKLRVCKSNADLNKYINLSEISNNLGLISLNSTIIDNIDFKRDLEIANKLYRDIELSYFERKIEFLNKKTEENFKDFEESLKEITGNTVFNIASVFLGISLTSALVSGVQFIEKDFIILYFLTCLLIITVTIGVTAIFIRKADKNRILCWL